MLKIEPDFENTEITPKLCLHVRAVGCDTTIVK